MGTLAMCLCLLGACCLPGCLLARVPACLGLAACVDSVGPGRDWGVLDGRMVGCRDWLCVRRGLDATSTPTRRKSTCARACGGRCFVQAVLLCKLIDVLDNAVPCPSAAAVVLARTKHCCAS